MSIRFQDHTHVLSREPPAGTPCFSDVNGTRVYYWFPVQWRGFLEVHKEDLIPWYHPARIWAKKT